MLFQYTTMEHWPASEERSVLALYYGGSGEQPVRWLNEYCSRHTVLLVGEGDFSFSSSLAMAFGSAFNIVATSLDSEDDLVKKYALARYNVHTLRRLGGTVLHGVDATKMKFHLHLHMRKFDRIIFNFPHAGFFLKEDSLYMIELHQDLVREFFSNASRMLREDGEIHVRHKITVPFSNWKIEELAASCLLQMVACVAFKKEDYPGYNNKRGAGGMCDQPFPLGKCSTYKFVIKDTRIKKCGKLQLVFNAQSKLQVSNAPVAEDEKTSNKFSMERPPAYKLIPNKMYLPTHNEPDEAVLESQKNQQVPFLSDEGSSSKMATINACRENGIRSRVGLLAPREPNELMFESTRQKIFKYGVGDPSFIPVHDILHSVDNQLFQIRHMRKQNNHELRQPPSFDYLSGITYAPEMLRRGDDLFHSLGSSSRSGNERWMEEEQIKFQAPEAILTQCQDRV